MEDSLLQFEISASSGREKTLLTFLFKGWARFSLPVCYEYLAATVRGEKEAEVVRREAY